MKARCFLVFLTVISVFAFANADLNSFVNSFEATGFVNDYAKLLNVQQLTQLEDKITAINDSTSIQFAICTVKSLENHSIKEFAKALGNFWGVGHQQLNNGVLFVTSVAERGIYIALGEGTEEYIESDYLKILISDVIKPAFVKGNFAEGLNSGIEKIYLKLRGSGIDMRVVKAKQKTNRIIYIIGVLLAITIILMLFFKMKSQKIE